MSVFISSCGKDDDPAKEPDPQDPVEEVTWKDAAGAFKASGSNTLTVNGQALSPTSKQEVALATGEGESAKLTLLNILPEDAEVVFSNVNVTKDGENYNFTGNTTWGSSKITVTGSLEGVKTDSKKFNLSYSRLIESSIAGKWLLTFDKEKGGDVRLDVKGSSSDDMFNILSGLLGGALAQKVSDVSLYFSRNGNFDVTWTNTGETTPTGMPDGIKDIIRIPYYERDGKVYIALDTVVLNSLMPMLENLIPSDSGINLLEYMGKLYADGILKDKGSYVALALNAKQEAEDKYSFYISKETVSPLYNLLSGTLLPLLSSVIPPSVLPLVGPILEALPSTIQNSTQFDMGLGFTRDAVWAE
jgi:hypothetical protein